MTLADDVRKAVEDSMVDVGYGRLLPFAQENGAFLNNLYELGVIDNSFVDGVVERIVLNQARDDFVYLTNPDSKGQRYADHCGSPESLGYALAKGAFSPEEVEKIPFDHGHTPTHFPYGGAGFVEQLRSDVLDQISYGARADFMPGKND